MDPSLGSEKKNFSPWVQKHNYSGSSLLTPQESALKHHVSSWNLTQQLHGVSHLQNTKESWVTSSIGCQGLYATTSNSQKSGLEVVIPQFSKAQVPSCWVQVWHEDADFCLWKQSVVCGKRKKKETYIFVKTCSKGTQHPQLRHHRDRQIMPGARAPNAICPAGGATVNC